MTLHSAVNIEHVMDVPVGGFTLDVMLFQIRF